MHRGSRACHSRSKSVRRNPIRQAPRDWGLFFSRQDFVCRFTGRAPGDVYTRMKSSLLFLICLPEICSMSMAQDQKTYSVANVENICPRSHVQGYVRRNSPLNSAFWRVIRDGDVKTLAALLTDNTNLNFTVDILQTCRTKKDRKLLLYCMQLVVAIPRWWNFYFDAGQT